MLHALLDAPQCKEDRTNDDLHSLSMTGMLYYFGVSNPTRGKLPFRDHREGDYDAFSLVKQNALHCKLEWIIAGASGLIMPK